jgi:CRP/FNR family transcriptional regulator
MSRESSALSDAACLAALRSCRLFGSLRPDDLRRIADFSHLRRVAKGVFLFHEGEPTHGFYIVRSGAIHVHRIAPDGREKSIHLFRAGESLAEATLAEGLGYPAHACAVEASVVVFVPRDDFLDLLKQRPDLSIKMLASMSQHLRVLVNALDDMNRKDVETRLAHWLLRRCPRDAGEAPVDIHLDVTKTVLAAELRVRQETLSRALQRLREANLIATQGRQITLTDPPRLRRLAVEGWNGI